LALTAPAARAAPFAYVANYGSNSVSVIDTASNTVTATVPLESNPNGVAVNPAGTWST
jgi:YVTN family beta-propeller protein